MNNSMDHEEYWQLYSGSGEILPNKVLSTVAQKDALLHGAAHVWIWRNSSVGGGEILLQLRASSKKTWPNWFDISAAGHIDLGENPLTAAIRETYEEIGLTIAKEDLLLVGVHKYYTLVPNTDMTENELRWIYILKVNENLQLALEDNEVESVKWVSLSEFTAMTKNPEEYKLVPQGSDYFAMLLKWLV